MVLSKLLTPICNDTPTGVNIRADVNLQNDYYELKDRRMKVRNKEKKEGDSSDLSAWKDIVEKSCDILGSYSKDLEICCWLIEGLVRLESFSGLAQGLQLLLELCEKFWIDLFPMPDEEGLEARIIAIKGLFGEGAPGTLITPLYRCPLSKETSSKVFALWQYKQAITAAQQNQDNTDLAAVLQAARESGNEFYLQQQSDLTSCLKLLAKLQNFFDDKCKENSPSTAVVFEVFDDLLMHVGYLLNELGTQAIPELKEETTSKKMDDEMPVLSINSRGQALELINQLAHYFEQKEPHSPLPYLLHRAVDWGQMSLPELWQEIIAEDSARIQVFKLTGIKL